MEPERLRILLDCDMSSHALVRILGDMGHDVVAADVEDELQPLPDPLLFAAAQSLERIVITHNIADFPDILRDWAESGRTHHGCIISTIPTNAYAEMEKRLSACLAAYPRQDDWRDISGSI